MAPKRTSGQKHTGPSGAARLDGWASSRAQKEEVVEKHPSYGMIQVGRISGGEAILFGTAAKPCHVIRLRIYNGVRRRNLNQDWYGTAGELIEVDMSPIQWAELITSMNFGAGTPCTLRRIAGKTMPECVEEKDQERVKDEFQATMRQVADDFRAGAARVDELMNDKKPLTQADRAEVKNVINRLLTELGLNLPFIHSQFDEAAERTLQAIKAEAEAAVSQLILARGLESLVKDGIRSPLALSGGDSNPAIEAEAGPPGTPE